MRLPWKRKKQISESAEEAITPTASSPVPFGGDLEDFTILRYHAVRALCGMLMDRHTACQSPHPFCNPGHRQDGDELQMFVAEVVPQGTKDTGYADLIGIYLCPAVAPKEAKTEKTSCSSSPAWPRLSLSRLASWWCLPLKMASIPLYTDQSSIQ